jgi:hypothetical protein
VRRMLAVALFLLGGTAGFAQVHGIPPSVTSLRPGERISAAPPPSVTSLGPLGFDGFRPQFPAKFRFRHDPRFSGGMFPVGQSFFPIVVPAYTPYPVYPLVYPMMYPYPAQAGGDSSYGDVDSTAERAVTDPSAMRTRREELTEPDSDATPDPPRRASAALAPAAPAPPPPNVPEQPVTVLVFQDGHQLQIRNYAIAGSQLYNYSDKGPRKIALSDLDLGATRQVNEDRGVEFRIPTRGGN